jgi:hypothetical protein
MSKNAIPVGTRVRIKTDYLGKTTIRIPEGTQGTVIPIDPNLEDYRGQDSRYFLCMVKFDNGLTNCLFQYKFQIKKEQQ